MSGLRYNHKSGDILSDDNMIVATVAGAYRRTDPSLGAKMAAGPELVEALTLAEISLGCFAEMREFEKWTDAYSGTQIDPNGVHAALGAVRAALAKATAP